MAQKDTIGSLAPLPGGNSNYLHTLHIMIGWLDAHPQVQRERFVAWVVEYFGTGAATVSNYLQTLTRLGVIHPLRSKKLVELTEQGRMLLHASDDERRQRIIAHLLARYTGLPETLALFGKADEPVTLDEVVATLRPDYPKWNTESPFQERIHWLLSLDCVEQIEGQRAYSITPLGFSAYDAADGAEAPQTVDLPLPERLRAAANSSDGQSFEAVVGEAFTRLGFTVQALGGAGDTDMLVYGWLGPATFSAIVETKARTSGRVDHLDFYALAEHQGRHSANYSLVVAADFARGRVARGAEEAGIGLLKVDVLAELVERHRHLPLSRAEYHSLFACAGLIDTIPQAVQQAIHHRENGLTLLNEVIAQVRESQHPGLNLQWSPNQLYNLLALQNRSVRYSLDAIEAACSLLTHPLVAGAVDNGDQFTLAMSDADIAQTLRRLADALGPPPSGGH